MDYRRFDCGLVRNRLYLTMDRETINKLNCISRQMVVVNPRLKEPPVR
jgi:hypothetical protein